MCINRSWNRREGTSSRLQSADPSRLCDGSQSKLKIIPAGREPVTERRVMMRTSQAENAERRGLSPSPVPWARLHAITTEAVRQQARPASR